MSSTTSLGGVLRFSRLGPTRRRIPGVPVGDGFTIGAGAGAGSEIRGWEGFLVLVPIDD